MLQYRSSFENSFDLNHFPLPIQLRQFAGILNSTGPKQRLQSGFLKQKSGSLANIQKQPHRHLRRPQSLHETRVAMFLVNAIFFTG